MHIVEHRQPLRRQPIDHNFGLLIMLAVTAGASDAILYHGTKASFTSFSDEYLESLGFHFGCLEQAKHFAVPGGRVISAHLQAWSLVDVQPNDCGWQQPQRTVIGLEDLGFISKPEADELLNGGDRSLASYRFLESREKRNVFNRKLVSLLESKGYDGIVYSNKQEPADGIPRIAYAVFHDYQIVQIESIPLAQLDVPAATASGDGD